MFVWIVDYSMKHRSHRQHGEHFGFFFGDLWYRCSWPRSLLAGAWRLRSVPPRRRWADTSVLYSARRRLSPFPLFPHLFLPLQLGLQHPRSRWPNRHGRVYLPRLTCRVMKSALYRTISYYCHRCRRHSSLLSCHCCCLGRSVTFVPQVLCKILRASILAVAAPT